MGRKRKMDDGSVTDEAEEDCSKVHQKKLKHQKKLEKRAKAKTHGAAVKRGETLPDELISEVLSFLDVKSLMRMKCVCKSWKSLISDDPTFIKMHLKKSARNKHLTVILGKSRKDTRVASFPLRHLLENRSIILADDDPYYQLKDCWVVGSCNGILCLLGQSYTVDRYWLFFWNPATGTISEKLGYFFKGLYAYFRISFGYDNSTDTYKAVALLHDRFIGEGPVRMNVRVFSLGENVWRNIQSFPVFAFDGNAGVYLSGTLNWLALSNGFEHDCWKDVVIISLDLATETHRQLPLPPGFDESPPVESNVSVLMDSLCFSHDFKRTYFVIWQMTEFGVGESWTQFLKIGYQNLQYDMTRLVPLCVSENGDIYVMTRLVPLCVSENGGILIWTDDSKNQAILYNWRDNRVKRARINDAMSQFIPKDYVESLVSPF